MNNIVILGGGTVGWLAALMVKQYNPHIPVTVVESEEIGILGAGEGTVPDFVKILTYLHIDIIDLIKECDGSFKLGITFTNWNGDSQSYFHGFGNMYFNGLNDEIKKLNAYLVGNNIPIQESLIGYHLVKQGRISLYKNNSDGKLDSHCAFALHFNARKLATFLRSVAESRGIGRVEGKVVDVVNKPNNDIDYLELDSRQKVSGDFFFDCSGFARLLVGKHYTTEWQSYNNHLPLDTALPFFVPHDNKNIKPHTEAIAMKYGWVWKIPVKDRYGCGYVFDSSYINEQQAIEEVEEYFKIKIETPKTFKFKAGGFKDTMVKNCAAVGLAQSFVEPLEATSIWVSCLNIRQILNQGLLHKRTDQAVAMFNKQARLFNQQVVDFLYLHYLTNRSDSDFWKEFREKNPAPPELMEFLQYWHDYGITDDVDLFDATSERRQVSIFSKESWLQVSDGLKLLNPSIFKELVERSDFTKDTLKKMSDMLTKNVYQCVPHDFYLEMARNFKK
jgi:tryptophan halogenase